LLWRARQAKNSCTFRTTFCYQQAKEGQTEALQEIRYSKATKPQINMGTLFPPDKYLKMI